MTDSSPATAQRILVTRDFDATREQVFRAWLDPAELSVWYGPAGVDTPRERIHVDARVGGRWELTMVQHGSGAEMSLGYEILELVEPELIVMRSDPMPEAGMPDGTLLRIELQDDGSRTRMTLSDGPYPAPGGDHAEAGWRVAFDKLATHLA